MLAQRVTISRMEVATYNSQFLLREVAQGVEPAPSLEFESHMNYVRSSLFFTNAECSRDWPRALLPDSKQHRVVACMLR
jgi:hypothetical protein